MILNGIQEAVAAGSKLLAVLIDPDKFDLSSADAFFQRIPKATTHVFVGGSSVIPGKTAMLLIALKEITRLPLLLFPGDYSQISGEAHALLFLSLLSGRNPDYLIGQQIMAVPRLLKTSLEIIPTAYLLIDGGTESAVQRISKTTPIPQADVEQIKHTALAGIFMGNKLVYLEAGSGANIPVNSDVISQVKEVLSVPLLVGGGMRNEDQVEQAFRAGADMVIIGNVLEDHPRLHKKGDSFHFSASNFGAFQ